MRLPNGITAPWALFFAGAAFVSELMFVAAGSVAQQQPDLLDQKIAAVERQIDQIEDDAIAGIPSILPGSPGRMSALGKILFFDKELSVKHNEACAFCQCRRRGIRAPSKASI